MQLIEHEHGFEIVNFSLLLQVIRGNSVVIVEVLQIQVFKCKLTIVKWPDKCKYGVIYIIIDMLWYIYKKKNCDLFEISILNLITLSFYFLTLLVLNTYFVYYVWALWDSS